MMKETASECWFKRVQPQKLLDMISLCGALYYCVMICSLANYVLASNLMYFLHSVKKPFLVNLLHSIKSGV